jgi:membrane protein implicated in regulation of membrane protease activity
MWDENLIMILVWSVLFVLTLIVEFSTDALVSIWFAIGALVAAGVTYIPGMPWWGELLVFLGVSLLSFAIIKPILGRKMLRIRSKTNIDALLNHKALVIKRISQFEKGEVKVGDVIYNAIKRESDPEIEIGDVVVILSVQGNKLLVQKTQEGGK